MGRAIDRERFGADDHRRFAARLDEQLAALRELLARPGFGEGETTIGAEVELSLVGDDGRPRPVNEAVIAASGDPRLTVELDRFNLECNGRPLPLAGASLTALAAELDDALAAVARASEEHRAHPVLIGILPTVRHADLGPHAMTDAPRFRALDAAIRRLRERDFALHIAGEDRLQTTVGDVSAEGANTSFQVHLRVAPRAFVATHAAAQLATAPALAAAGNSPLFLGCRLWEETRIALFKQAVDERADMAEVWRPPARVSFGSGWVRASAAEPFAESVALHEPLLPACGDEDAPAVVRAGGVPRLDELRLHHGTVWRWNRAIYDPDAGGHLRIELRALPSGPTVADMVANAAFALGLTLALREEVEALLPALPFEYAHANFYRAARHGLDATLLWPAPRAPSPRPVRAGELVARLLPRAHQGLVAAGVDEADAARWLGVVAARVASGQTGARWQRRALARLARGAVDDRALAALVARYRAEAASGRPVHEWGEP